MTTTNAIAMRIVDLRMEGTELSFNRRRSRASTAVISERLYGIVGKRPAAAIVFRRFPHFMLQFRYAIRTAGRYWNRPDLIRQRSIALRSRLWRRDPTAPAFAQNKRG